MLDDKYKKIFSKNLTYYMNLRGKSQADIINDLNINKSAISSWCNGTRLPRMNKVQLLANYLNINLSDLIEDNSNSNCYFEFVAEDDAMFPLLDIGDIALVYKKSDIENGSTYLIKLDGKNTIRKIIFNETNSLYELIAMNAYCKTIKVKKNEISNIEIIRKSC